MTKETAETKETVKKTVAKKTAAPKKTVASKKETTAAKPKVEVVKKPASKVKAKSMEDLKEAVAEAAAVAAVEVTTSSSSEPNKVDVTHNTAKPKKKDSKGRYYATGKRKDACARVWIKLGTGKITVNGKDLEKYFARPVLRMMINQPFTITNRVGQYDIICTVAGGGLSGQAGALRHGISRCLDMQEPELHATLRKAGFLTRDPRTVERKKYGRSGARKRYQFSKR